MTRIFKMNVAGIAASALAVLASTAILSGCGPAPAVRPAPVTAAPGTAPLVSPQNVPQNQQLLNDLGQFNSAQIAGLMGRYTGTFQAEDANYNKFSQSYTVVLSQVASGGKNYAQATFTAGNMSFQSMMQTNYMASTWGSTGATYTFTSIPQNVPSVYSGAPIILQLQLTVNSSNQFDPTQSPIINIVDSVLFQSVVAFYNDLAKH